MPLENLFVDSSATVDPRQAIYKRFGVLGNPFPNAAQTSGHPHLDTDADKTVDAAVKGFISNRESQAWAVTASQGIGKTNFLNAYEDALQRKLSDRGFYVIRYLADPDPSFDQLLRQIIEQFGEEHLRKLIETAKKPENKERLDVTLQNIRVNDVPRLFERLIKYNDDENRFQESLSLAYQWLLGLRVLKAHQDRLGIYYRLDTVEVQDAGTTRCGHFQCRTWRT
ncbi:MAG: hypothetical protein R3F37_23825 [Candidatus Competibacteraceae bacterium]